MKTIIALRARSTVRIISISLSVLGLLACGVANTTPGGHTAGGPGGKADWVGAYGGRVEISYGEVQQLRPPFPWVVVTANVFEAVHGRPVHVGVKDLRIDARDLGGRRISLTATANAFETGTWAGFELAYRKAGSQDPWTEVRPSAPLGYWRSISNASEGTYVDTASPMETVAIPNPYAPQIETLKTHTEPIAFGCGSDCELRVGMIPLSDWGDSIDLEGYVLNLSAEMR